MSEGDTETDDKYDRSDEFTDSDNNAIGDDGDKYTGHSFDHKDKELYEKTQNDKYVPPYGNKTKCCNDSSSSDEDIQNGSSSLTDEEFSDEIETCEPFQHEKEGTLKPNKQRQPLKRALKRVIWSERKSSKGKLNTKLTKLEEQYQVLKKEVDSIAKFKQDIIQYCRNKQQQCEVNTNMDKHLKKHNFFHKSRKNRNRIYFTEVEEMIMTGRFNEVAELRRPEMIPMKSSKFMQHTSERGHGSHLLRVFNNPDIGQSINMVCNMRICPQIDRFLYSIFSITQHHENHPYNHQQTVLLDASCDQELIASDTEIGAYISADHAIVDLNQLVRSDLNNINVSERTKDRMIYESVVFIDNRQSNGVIIVFRIRQYSSCKIEYELTWSTIQTTQNAPSTSAQRLRHLDSQVGVVISADHAVVDLNQLVRSDCYTTYVSELTKDRMIYESVVFIDKRQSNGSILIFRVRQYSSGKIEYDLTWSTIQTTQNTFSTNADRLSHFDIGASISICRCIERIQYDTNAAVELGSVFPFLRLHELTNEANDLPSSNYTGQIVIPTLLKLDILRSHKNAINLVAQPKQNHTRPVPLEECNTKPAHCSFILSTLMNMRRQNETRNTKGALNEYCSNGQRSLKAILKPSRKNNKERRTDHFNYKTSAANKNYSKQLTAIIPVRIKPAKINKRCQSQASNQYFTDERSKYNKFRRFNLHTTNTLQTMKNSKRNKAGKLKTSKHPIADGPMSREAGTVSPICNDKPKTLKTLQTWWHKASKKQNNRSPNRKVIRPGKMPPKNQRNFSRVYLLQVHRKATPISFARNQRLDTQLSHCLMLKKGPPYVKRHKDRSRRFQKVEKNQGKTYHVDGGIYTNLGYENHFLMRFGCANGDVYGDDTYILEEDLCLYGEGTVGETIQYTTRGKGIVPTGIEENTEIHTIRDIPVHEHLHQQFRSKRMHIVQPTREQEERSEICTTLSSYDKNRIPNCRPIQLDFGIPLAGGTSAHIVLKNTCCIDGFLLMIFVVLEENLKLRSQFEHSEHELHKIYHQIWKRFTVGDFGDGKIAWGKYGGYIADLGATGVGTEEIIDIIGTENERIFCVLGKHRFSLRVHCSLVENDVYFTTQLYNVLPLYQVQGEPLYDTIKRAINKYLRGDDLPCYRSHGNIKEKCRGKSIKTLVEPPLILPINLFFLNYGEKKYSSNEIPEIVECNEHRYELHLVRFFIEGVKHFVDKIKIYGSWAFYDDCREKLCHFDVDPEYVQLSSCYFVKV
ncbi:uncharacterized protein LOC134721765 [Mytilus trossulus]|uniref:uncharacterized protein LOC134721765 n=1 Tax=Mytilus trossulus TaxID=6551 RepID=UPI00300550FF